MKLFHGKTSWKSLEILVCSDCDLQVSDLISLSEANAASYLPVLKHLRLRRNKQIGGHLMKLFQGKTSWKSLEMLDCSECSLQAPDLISLSQANAAGYLPVLRHIDLGWNQGLGGNLHELLHTQSTWASLEILELYRLTESEGESLLHALQEGRFPKLNTVKYYTLHVSVELKGKMRKHVKLEEYD